MTAKISEIIYLLKKMNTEVRPRASLTRTKFTSERIIGARDYSVLYSQKQFAAIAKLIAARVPFPPSQQTSLSILYFDFQPGGGMKIQTRGRDGYAAREVKMIAMELPG